MTNILQVRRGAFGDLPTLNAGEIGLCTDTYQVFIGDGATNHEVGMLGSGAALTKSNDTNVTLTLGGTPNSALLTATSLTLGWIGQLAASRGGTGINNVGTFTNATNSAITGGGTLALGGYTFTIPATGTSTLGTGTQYHVALWSNTNTVKALGALGTVGYYLRSGGVGVDPTWAELPAGGGGAEILEVQVFL